MIVQILRAFRLIWKYARSFFIGRFIFIIISAALVSMNVLYTQKLIDNLIGFINKEYSAGDLVFSALLLGLILLLETMLVSVDGLLDIICEKNLTNNLEPVIIKKFRNLEYFCYEDKDVQDTIQRMSGQPYTRIKMLFIHTLSMFQIIFTLVGLIAIYTQVTIWLGVMLVVFLVPMLWVNYKSSFYLWQLYSEQSSDERALNYLDGLLTTKASVFELKVYKAMGYIEKLWNEKSTNMLKQKSRVLLKVQRMLFTKSFFATLWYSVSIITTLACFLDNKITIGLFVSLVNVTISVVDRISDLSRTFGSISKEAMEMSYYDNFMMFPEYEEGKEKPLSHIREIKFENIRFKYPNTDTEILKGINLTLKSNENVALVGVNGAGKSTIIKLLCKLYKPDSGRILVDGIDLQEISYQNIRSVISVLFQDYFNYQLTIRENLAFGDIEKINDDGELIKTLKKSNVYNIYELASNGLDSNLGKIEDDGVDLSGGQWQRLAIARACLSGGSIVVLDEPTAALDPFAESEMYMQFFNIMKERGTVMISHRLASSKMADRIIVINDGIVAEEGTHECLMSQKGLYSEMYNMQASWYKTGGEEI